MNTVEDIQSDKGVSFCNHFCFMVSLLEGPGQVEYEKVHAIQWQTEGIDFMVFFRRSTGLAEIHAVPNKPGYTLPQERDVRVLEGRRFGKAILVMKDGDDFVQSSAPFAERADAFAAFSELARSF